MDVESLLNDVKATVEGLLSHPTSNVWSVYGGLKRLTDCVENVFSHGLRYSQDSNKRSTLDYNQFIKSLHWLDPMLVPSNDKIKKIATEESISEGQAWIRQSLQSHTMSLQLRTLVRDKQHLLTSYYADAYLCQPFYLEALCICLEAVEQNNPSLLTNINYNLIKQPAKNGSLQPSRRLSNDGTPESIDPLSNELVINSLTLKRKGGMLTPTSMKSPTAHQPPQRLASLDSQILDSILNDDHHDNSNTDDEEAHQETKSKKGKGKQPMKRSKGHQRSKSDWGFLKGQQNQGGSPEPNGIAAVVSSSLPDNDKAMEERIRNASYIENSMHTGTEGYFPQPRQGESLKSFLSSQDFDTCAELDRENAHFAISEALIAAIEYMKWNQVLRPAETVPLEDSEVDSDEEINRLKQKIQERKQQKMNKRLGQISDRSSSIATPKSSSHGSSIRDSDSLFSEEDDFISTPSDSESLLTIRDPLGSEGSMIVSAEQVALSLLSQFNEYHLPKADELIWLVSEKDAPQALLPLPDSLPISPDDMTEGRKGTRIRGNAEWAPPRAQIIFNLHPPPRRKLLIARQNYRCAGCGMKIEPGFIKRFSYCEYLGKYFCHCCHTNQISRIPARILQKWDFREYYVSNFAHDLLEKIAGDPLFNIVDVNPELLQKSTSLKRVTKARLKLKHARLFLAQCRLGTSDYEKLVELPSYLLDDVHVYSLKDLVSTKFRDLEPRLEEMSAQVFQHIFNCPLCQAKGFICEICDNERDVIYPFQLERVYRCPDCHSCYHSSCFNKVQQSCPKCHRIEIRKQKMDEQSS